MLILNVSVQIGSKEINVGVNRHHSILLIVSIHPEQYKAFILTFSTHFYIENYLFSKWSFFFCCYVIYLYIDFLFDMPCPCLGLALKWYYFVKYYNTAILLPGILVILSENVFMLCQEPHEISSFAICQKWIYS